MGSLSQGDVNQMDGNQVKAKNSGTLFLTILLI